MSRVDLLVPELSSRDAIGTHTLLMRDLLVDHGVDSVRLVTQVPTTTDEEVTLVGSWRDPAELVIVQHGIGSFVADAVISSGVECVVNYHNITPVEYLEPWDPGLIPGLRWGRSQLDQMAPLAKRALAVSEYNAQELLSSGYDDVKVAPVMWRSHGSDANPGRGDRQPVVLFVGRVVPNKCHEDLLKAISFLLQNRPEVRLVVVGSPAIDDYARAVAALVDELGLSAAVEFTGAVDDEELANWYRRASVFLCLSDHEGFCVPVVEAMAAGLPVVAHSAAALPETVAGAGLVLGDKRPGTVAAALERVLDDDALWSVMSEAGTKRASYFALSESERSTWRALEDLVPT